MSSSRPDTYPSPSFSNRELDETSTLHSQYPANASRVHLVTSNMDTAYDKGGSGPASDDDHLKVRAHFKESPGARPTQGSRRSSWDMLSGMKHEFEGFDFKTSTAREEHLRFAEGDFATDSASRFYNYLLNLSIITRWILYIFPVLGLAWIPGILSLTAYQNAQLWGVRLLYWSIWLTVFWGGWWAAFACAKLLPYVLRATVGVVAVSMRKYIDFCGALERYIALFGWSLALWISFARIIVVRDGDATPTDQSGLATAQKVFQAIFVASCLLLAEKLAIQYIALQFHHTSYADRIAEQKMHTRFLVTLYQHSSNIPGRLDTLNDDVTVAPRGNPKKVLKEFIHSIRNVAETTTTALGNVASEIAGASILQPNSPEGRVSTALMSANKTRLLARRLYYSFRAEGSKSLILNDIARFFPNFETAQLAFQMFDRDGNGDATRDEVEMACMEVHRERLSLSASMRNIDSAVGRLDAILVYVWVVVALVILVISLDASVSTTITTTGTLVLGLSWLIGGTATEVLASIIFLFVKHPYDCGDRVDIDTYQFTVKEIQLLSTVFVTLAGKSVQVPHAILNTKYIENVRRSGQMSELFTFDVAFGTTFEQIEQLRSKMLSFVSAERRDFLPQFDVTVQDIPDQSKMVLTAYIKHKSNWQQVALQAQRRNKWICALKESLKDLKIFGPSGDPGAAPGTNHVTLVPWEEVKPVTTPTSPPPPSLAEPLVPRGDWNLSDRNAVLRDDSRDVFGVAEELQSTTRTTRPNTPGASRPGTRPGTPEYGYGGLRGPRAQPRPPPLPGRSYEGEEIEMRGSSSGGGNNRI